jgi:hypothetical protein
MTKIKLKALLVVGFVIFGVCCFLNTKGTCVGSNNADCVGTNNNANGNTNTNTDTPPTMCNASSTWVSSPSAPNEIPNNGPTLCEFHQFSWQTFLALMNPPSADAQRAFQDELNFPLLQAKGTDSCGATKTQSRLFIRNSKDDNGPNDDFVLPEDIKQAGDGSILYDQNGNVVFYEVRFSRSECTQDPAKTQFTDPNTTEIKVSYRVITEADKPNYVWINADINGDGTTGANELLGMVGFHLVKSTPLHPEFVWATFEHKSNVPECQTQPATKTGWSFLNEACAAELPNSVSAQCNFNIPPTPPSPVLSGGPPTPVCRAYHDGSKPGDNQFDANVADIDNLNNQLVGPTGFITALDPKNPLAVLKNYMLVGALWESDITQPSTVLANQRGSIQLTNTTMETSYQMAPNFTPVAYTGTSNLQPATNCFACHGYTPNNNVAESHIFAKIKGQ